VKTPADGAEVDVAGRAQIGARGREVGDLLPPVLRDDVDVDLGDGPTRRVLASEQVDTPLVLDRGVRVAGAGHLDDLVAPAVRAGVVDFEVRHDGAAVGFAAEGVDPRVDAHRRQAEARARHGRAGLPGGLPRLQPRHLVQRDAVVLATDRVQDAGRGRRGEFGPRAGQRGGLDPLAGRGVAPHDGRLRGLPARPTDDVDVPADAGDAGEGQGHGQVGLLRPSVPRRGDPEGVGHDLARHVAGDVTGAELQRGILEDAEALDGTERRRPFVRRPAIIGVLNERRFVARHRHGHAGRIGAGGRAYVDAGRRDVVDDPDLDRAAARPVLVRGEPVQILARRQVERDRPAELRVGGHGLLPVDEQRGPPGLVARQDQHAVVGGGRVGVDARRLDTPRDRRPDALAADTSVFRAGVAVVAAAVAQFVKATVALEVEDLRRALKPVVAQCDGVEEAALAVQAEFADRADAGGVARTATEPLIDTRPARAQLAGGAKASRLLRRTLQVAGAAHPVEADLVDVAAASLRVADTRPAVGAEESVVALAAAPPAAVVAAGPIRTVRRADRVAATPVVAEGAFRADATEAAAAVRTAELALAGRRAGHDARAVDAEQARITGAAVPAAAIPAAGAAVALGLAEIATHTGDAGLSVGTQATLTAAAVVAAVPALTLRDARRDAAGGGIADLVVHATAVVVAGEAGLPRRPVARPVAAAVATVPGADGTVFAPGRFAHAVPAGVGRIGTPAAAIADLFAGARAACAATAVGTAGSTCAGRLAGRFTSAVDTGRARLAYAADAPAAIVPANPPRALGGTRTALSGDGVADVPDRAAAVGLTARAVLTTRRIAKAVAAAIPAVGGAIATRLVGGALVVPAYARPGGALSVGAADLPPGTLAAHPPATVGAALTSLAGRRAVLRHAVARVASGPGRARREFEPGVRPAHLDDALATSPHVFGTHEDLGIHHGRCGVRTREVPGERIDQRARRVGPPAVGRRVRRPPPAAASTGIRRTAAQGHQQAKEHRGQRAARPDRHHATRNLVRRAHALPPLHR
jgi:hypothetical protein